MCNESKPHTALVGNDITYQCRFTFYGRKVEPFVWEGPGTSGGAKFVNIAKSNETIWKNTYNGEQRRLLENNSPGEMALNHVLFLYNV